MTNNNNSLKGFGFIYPYMHSTAAQDKD